MEKAIGLVEFTSVARGMECVDAMLKAAEVELVLAKPLCPGKYMCLVAGETAAAESAVRAGLELGAEFVVGHTLIPNVHPGVFPAVYGAARYELESLGVIEVFNVATTVRVADAAVKAAAVTLIEVRLSVGLGGKGFVTLTGEVGAVRTAVDVGAALAAKAGELVASTVIPAPHDELGRAVSSPV